jgi:hypothetical protein
VLNDGESLLAAVPPHHRALFEQLAEASPDSSVMLPFSIWREAFINDADLDVARASYEQLSPEPCQQMTEPLAISTARIARLEALAHMCNRGVVCAVGPNLTATRRVNVSTDFQHQFATVTAERIHHQPKKWYTGTNSAAFQVCRRVRNSIFLMVCGPRRSPRGLRR